MTFRFIFFYENGSQTSCTIECGSNNFTDVSHACTVGHVRIEADSSKSVLPAAPKLVNVEQPNLATVISVHIQVALQKLVLISLQEPVCRTSKSRGNCYRCWWLIAQAMCFHSRRCLLGVTLTMTLNASVAPKNAFLDLFLSKRDSVCEMGLKLMYKPTQCNQPIFFNKGSNGVIQ